MDAISEFISALSRLAWPMIFGFLLYKFYEPIKSLIESARSRKFTIKVAGNELSMEEATEQQRVMTTDILEKIAALEEKVNGSKLEFNETKIFIETKPKKILWVDDRPKNNSYLVASIEGKGHKVDIALSTTEGVEKFQNEKYDIVISDMGRPEDGKAGIVLAKLIREMNNDIPFYIFCGGRAASGLRNESIDNGVTEITSSGSTLIRLLGI